ncbi:MAG: sulfite dehydrogenase [Terriglobia bacterium]
MKKEHSRRRFLKGGVALAGLAAGGIRPASGQTPGSQPAENLSAGLVRAIGERSPFEASKRTWIGQGRITSSLTPLQNSRGIITPSALHFERHHAQVPNLDPRQHRLLIHGMVDRPLLFTVEDLMRLPSVSRIHFVECSGNTNPARRVAADAQGTHGMTSCSEWTGVPLSLLLQEAGVQRAASWLVAEGADSVKMSRSVPLRKAMDDILVAYGKNGEALRPEQGYPLRLLVPGWEGNINVKWVRQIKVVDQPYMTRDETSKYTDLMPDGKARQFTFEMDPKSVITFPSGGQKLGGPGFYEITGLAWSGRGAIRRVEVSTDGGASWKDATLQEPVLRFAHTRFRLAWNWNGQETVLQSRSTDEQGGFQPTLAEIIRVRGNAYTYHASHIQAWKINRDGSVQNGLV